MALPGLFCYLFRIKVYSQVSLVSFGSNNGSLDIIIIIIIIRWEEAQVVFSQANIAPFDFSGIISLKKRNVEF